MINDHHSTPSNDTLDPCTKKDEIANRKRERLMLASLNRRKYFPRSKIIFFITDRNNNRRP